MTVLVGYLPTPEGNAAFTAALDEAARRREALVVLSSPRDGALVSTELPSPDDTETLQAQAQQAGVSMDLRTTPHRGELPDLLIETAEEINASVIVIGLRRRTAIGELFLGSTAQQILLGAERPVLAVKARR
ncbi:universal stress protein UspA [Streptomyces variegatus]|uniref:Universal stress protein UspA n=1 Tax=Streptomyces variegatus TaxID=284040 RepID=A0A0M2GCA4_9ACTN|nr:MULTISPECIES: universal stress protein [Streptomyces]KJK34538.1 universal stress protein UspA [Streptomyces variegatus]